MNFREVLDLIENLQTDSQFKVGDKVVVNIKNKKQKGIVISVLPNNNFKVKFQNGETNIFSLDQLMRDDSNKINYEIEVELTRGPFGPNLERKLVKFEYETSKNFPLIYPESVMRIVKSNEEIKKLINQGWYLHKIKDVKEI